MYEDLYQQNRNLLWQLANKYRHACEQDRAVDAEDLAQAGFFGLVKAAESYDPNVAKTWSGWASWHIKNEFRNLLGLRKGGLAAKAHAGAISLDAPLSSEDNESETLGDVQIDEAAINPEEAALHSEIVRAMRKAIAELPEDERLVMQSVGLEGKSYEQAAQSLGTTQGHIGAIRRRATDNLRRRKDLQALDDLDLRTRFIARKSIDAFSRDQTSTVEEAVLWREQFREYHGKRAEAN